ncbi:MAG: NAD(P)-binding protein, partial [Xanthobacteraceae bacterium]|nr:NAD(P)-binding protein [Xanthobacteraceae bacterium]
MLRPNLDALPVAVIGGGPGGLAAAAHLLAHGLVVKLYEAGPAVGSNIRDWGHIRIFTPWRYCVDAAAGSLLASHGWQSPPADVLPTGHELVANYLEPLAATPELRTVIETNARVTAISRQGLDKVVSRERAAHPFVLRVNASGHI